MKLLSDDFYRVIKNFYPSIEKEKIVVFDEGWDYIVCVVDDEMVFRFPRRDDYAATLPREVTFLKKFSTISSVQVPVLTLHHLQDGKPYVTYPFISGVQFKEKISDTFSKMEHLKTAQQLGNFLGLLHTFPLTEAKKIGLQELNTHQIWNERFGKIKQSVFPHLSEYEQNWAALLFREFLTMIQKNPPSNTLTHSDIMPEHIIVDPNTHLLKGLIDFGDIVIADPAYDFTFLNKYGRDFLEAVYDAYLLDKDEDFEKRRQFYEDRVVLTNLEHAITMRNEEKISLYKKQLKSYID